MMNATMTMSSHKIKKKRKKRIDGGLLLGTWYRYQVQVPVPQLLPVQVPVPYLLYCVGIPGTRLFVRFFFFFELKFIYISIIIFKPPVRLLLRFLN